MVQPPPGGSGATDAPETGIGRLTTSERVAKLATLEAFMNDKLLGSVMVVGGGIAGMQAALDIANSGYYVHLVEKGPAIGGVMAQLDKTFPTNDCAM